MATDLTMTTAEGFWDQQGIVVTMQALDNTNGNQFVAQNDALAIVQNTDSVSRSVQFTSQSDADAGRTGGTNINQVLAAGEIRVFRFTKSGWADSNGNVQLPSGQNANLKAGIVKLR